MLFIDSHVHAYDPSQLHLLLDTAYANFQRNHAKLSNASAFTPVIFLADTWRTDCFSQLLNVARDEPAPDRNISLAAWSLTATDESVSLIAQHPECDQDFVILGGYQFVSEERLEILVFGGTTGCGEGAPALELIHTAIERDLLIIVPWGFGKWLGQRGRQVTRLIDTVDYPLFFIGDNGGRPKFFPEPAHFSRSNTAGISILRGSDPLPLAHDYKRVGNYGFYLDREISAATPFASLRRALEDNQAGLNSYGSLTSPFKFVRNQVGLHIRKRAMPHFA